MGAHPDGLRDAVLRNPGDRTRGSNPPADVRLSLRRVLRPLLDFLYPPLCLSCGCRLAEGGSLLCSTCITSTPRLDRDDGVLARARQRLLTESNIEDLRVLWLFEGPVRDLVHAIKYNGLWSAAEEAGMWLGISLELSAGSFLPDIIVPVPLHPARMRERGYNQSACIARGISRILGVPVCEDAAARTRNTATQTSLDRCRRRENVAGAFRVRRPELVRQAGVLIVDDVVTTGSTVGALAAELQDAGSCGCAVAGLAIAPADGA